MDTKSDMNPSKPPYSENRKNSGVSANRSSRSQKLEALCQEIERTRQETEKTINELEQRLSFAGLKAQLRDKAQKLTMGKVNIMDMENQVIENSKSWAGTVIETVRQNPLPAMMIGGGLAWLAARLAGRELEESQYPFDAHYDRRQKNTVDETGTYGLGFIERRKVAESAAGLKKKAVEKAVKIKGELSRKFRETGQRSGETGSRIREEALKTTEQVKHRAEEMGSTAADYGRRAQDRVAQSGRRVKAGIFQFVENHPLAVAGIVLAAGAVAGMAIPESRYEDRKLGPAREKALDRAREMGREEVEKVKAVAKEAKEAAKDEADRQDLLKREKFEEIEAKATRAAEQARSKVREGADAVKGKFDQK